MTKKLCADLSKLLMLKKQMVDTGCSDHSCLIDCLSLKVKKYKKAERKKHTKGLSTQLKYSKGKPKMQAGGLGEPSATDGK